MAWERVAGRGEGREYGCSPLRLAKVRAAAPVVCSAAPLLPSVRDERGEPRPRRDRAAAPGPRRWGRPRPCWSRATRAGKEAAAVAMRAALQEGHPPDPSRAVRSVDSTASDFSGDVAQQGARESLGDGRA